MKIRQKFALNLGLIILINFFSQYSIADEDKETLFSDRASNSELDCEASAGSPEKEYQSDCELLLAIRDFSWKVETDARSSHNSFELADRITFSAKLISPLSKDQKLEITGITHKKGAENSKPVRIMQAHLPSQVLVVKNGLVELNTGFEGKRPEKHFHKVQFIFGKVGIRYKFAYEVSEPVHLFGGTSDSPHGLISHQDAGGGTGN